MISLHININNPWNKGKFKNLWNKSWLLFKNTGAELEVIYHDYDIAAINFALTFRQDHAGIVFSVGLLYYNIHFTLYDTRHWDIANNQWQTYE